MTEFSILWDTKVKEAARKCVVPEIVQLMMLSEDEATDEKINRLKELSDKYVDLLAQYYVSQMMWAIEHDLADGREVGGGVLSAMQVRDTMNSESYWQNVWIDKGKDVESEEARNLKALAVLLNELLEKAV